MPSTFFAACSEASGASIVQVKYYLKASVKNMALGFEGENQTTPRQGAHFFTNTVLQKS